MRKLKMKKIISLLLTLIMIFALAACGNKAADTSSDTEVSKSQDESDLSQDKNNAEETKSEDNESQAESDLSYVKGNGKLVIGYTKYAPMNYEDENGELTGFDTELAIITCEKLGVKPEFVEINWDTKEIELNAKTIDCIWNGLTITPERQQTMEITKPYVKNAQVVLMKKGAAYDSTESLIGKTVVAEQGSVGEETIMADENLKQANYVPKNLQTDCLLELKSGTADAAVLDLTLAKTMTGEGTNFEDIVIVDYLAEEDYGVAFRKGSDICAEVNKIFDELRADGIMAALAEKYGLELAE
ncbi:MAG TPA: amino acid ABC transporter substrate-binding protein [Clostridiaceae bacterium]|nr:amino acid ABC transporter substrate-binding protein [Clostridiaceae bacterium]